MMDVSRETEDRLRAYVELLKKWNPRINLVSAESIKDAATRHIEDCFQLAELTASTTGQWLDLGSGGGFPGLVVAIALAEADITFTMIESDSRKAAFLRTVTRELTLTNTAVINQRIEVVPPQNADNLSARALAPLDVLLGMAARHLAPGGTAWLMKGRMWKAEVDHARHLWQFDMDAIRSKTDPEAAILKITGVSAHV